MGELSRTAARRAAQDAAQRSGQDAAQRSGGESVPLARLFAMGLEDLVAGLHERLAARGRSGVRPGDGYVLLAARGRAVSSSEVAALTGTSRQAAAKLTERLVADGLLAREPSPDDARVVLLRLTPDGELLLAEVEDVYAELEQQWAALLGARRLESLRRDLTAVLRRRNGGELPPVRRSV